MISDVVFTKLSQFVDSRGAVLHMINKNSKTFLSFGEIYFSEIFPGAVKAWKKHLKHTQNFAVPSGKIKLVLYDDRAHSTSKGELQIVEIGRPDDYLLVTVPPNLWYGFSCVGQEKALLVNCTDFPYDGNESVVLNFDSNFIPYEWN